MNKIYNGEYKITSPFGERVLPNDDNRFHKGEDHVGIDSKIIVTPTSGIIVTSTQITNKSNPTWEWGNYVKMDDLNGYYLYFCHLSSRLVLPLQRVEEGQSIGVEGQTGYALGSHCHFEVRRKKDNVSINPREYFNILYNWEENHYKKLTQERFNFDENTMNFLSTHQYKYDLFKKLSTIK